MKKQVHRQEALNTVAGRKPMHQIQATVAMVMEQQQMSLDMIATAAGGPAIYSIYIEELTRSSF